MYFLVNNIMKIHSREFSTYFCFLFFFFSFFLVFFSLIFFLLLLEQNKVFYLQIWSIFTI